MVCRALRLFSLDCAPPLKNMPLGLRCQPNPMVSCVLSPNPSPCAGRPTRTRRAVRCLPRLDSRETLGAVASVTAVAGEWGVRRTAVKTNGYATEAGRLGAFARLFTRWSVFPSCCPCAVEGGDLFDEAIIRDKLLHGALPVQACSIHAVQPARRLPHATMFVARQTSMSRRATFGELCAVPHVVPQLYPNSTYGNSWPAAYIGLCRNQRYLQPLNVRGPIMNDALVIVSQVAAGIFTLGVVVLVLNGLSGLV